MSLKDLVSTNVNMGNGIICLYNSVDEHRSFRGRWCDIENSVVANFTVINWTFVPVEQFASRDWDFELNVTISA